MNLLAKSISAWREDKGFFTPSSLDTEQERNTMLGKLMLVVSEVSEMAEAVRYNDIENFTEECADVIIRILDITGTMNIDIEKAINEKMEINKIRPVKHGKKCSL